MKEFSDSDIKKKLNFTVDTVTQAGEILMRYWRVPIDVHFKKDEFDPVTRADMESDAFIRNEIAKNFPDDLILSEENTINPESFEGRVWMADPLDSTNGYIRGFDSFGVSIGYLENGILRLGAVGAPARGLVYYGSKGIGAFVKKGSVVKQIIGSAINKLSEARVINGLPPKESRPIHNKILGLKVKEFIENASIAVSMARIAAGDAECAVCTNPRVSKWDSAGGQGILEAVGGVVTDTKGRPLDYKQAERGWPNLVVASVNSAIHAEFITAINA